MVDLLQPLHNLRHVCEGECREIQASFDESGVSETGL
jgi:hypothetical protein